MSNPLTAARRSSPADGGALRCTIPRTRPTLTVIPAVASPISARAKRPGLRAGT